MKRFILILLLLITACIPAPKRALPTSPAQSVYYVSTSGSDSNAGTIDAPLKTVGKVNSLALKAGDTILFKRGDMWMMNSGGDTGALNIVRSGTAGSPITYGAYGIGERPIFDGAKQSDSAPMNGGMVVIGYSQTVSYVTVRNLELRNGLKENISIGDGSGGNADNIIIEDMSIHSNRTSGFILFYIKSHGSTKDIVIRNNTIYDSKWNGMRITGGIDNISIYGNTIYDVLHNGIDTYPSNKNNSKVKIYGNNIYAFGGGNGGGVYMPGCTDCEVHDNDIHDVTPSTNDVYGIKVGKVSALSFTNSNVSVHDNRIWNVTTSNSNSHWGWGDSCKNCSFTNNLICNSAGGYFSGVTQSGNKVSVSLSACLATGSPTPIWTVNTPSETQNTPSPSTKIASSTPTVPTVTSTPTPKATNTVAPEFPVCVKIYRDRADIIKCP